MTGQSFNRELTILIPIKPTNDDITLFDGISVAAEKMVGEDYWGAMLEFESILAEYPLDPYSLHMAYFLALTIGNSQPDAI
jgi:hypothetical protein